VTAFQNTIIDAFTTADAATTTVEKGRALESLIQHIFSQCPGVRHSRNNAINVAGSSEFDVCFWNNLHFDSLDFLPRIIVVECKNTAGRIGSPDLRVFRDKLKEIKVDSGILIAANGITGTLENRKAAHDVIRTAYIADQTRIILLTRAELESITDISSLIVLLQDKVLNIVMGSVTF